MRTGEVAKRAADLEPEGVERAQPGQWRLARRSTAGSLPDRTRCVDLLQQQPSGPPQTSVASVVSS